MQKRFLKITVLVVGIFLFFHAQSLKAQSAGAMMSSGTIKGQSYDGDFHPFPNDVTRPMRNRGLFQIL